jgi:hypothetical protein
VLLNINFPALPPSKVKRVSVAAQGQRDQSMLRVEERQDARGRTYFWIGFKRIFSDPPPGTDLRAMVEGAISVTPLHLNLTELKEYQRLSALIDGPVALDYKAARNCRWSRRWMSAPIPSRRRLTSECTVCVKSAWPHPNFCDAERRPDVAHFRALPSKPGLREGCVDHTLVEINDFLKSKMGITKRYQIVD